MLKTFFLTIFLFLSTQVLASDSFIEYFEYEARPIPEHTNDITLYFTEDSKESSKSRLSTFKMYQSDLTKALSINSKDPLLKFILGLNLRNTLTALEEQKKLGARNIEPLIQSTKEDMQAAFSSAIRLDNTKKSHLTSSMYASMKHNLSEAERILALQKELSLGGSGDNETQYWFTHWDVIGSLQDEGRYDEAEKALNTMQKELKAAGLNSSDFKQIYQKAKSNLAEDHTLGKTKDNSSLEQTKAAQKEKQSALFTTLKDKFENYWFMILLNIFIVGSLIVAFIKRDRD